MSKCSDHPLAPHGFDRNASYMDDDYFCDCNGWIPPVNYVEIGWKEYLVLETEDSGIISIQKEGGDQITSFTKDELEWLFDKDNFD